VKATAVHTEGCFEPFFALDESSSHMTLCWREMDSNHRYPAKFFHRALTMFAPDSTLEQSGFELSVPLALKLVVSRKRELDGGILIGDDDGMIP
jgi:hypothetical protein